MEFLISFVCDCCCVFALLKQLNVLAEINLIIMRYTYENTRNQERETRTKNGVMRLQQQRRG